MPSLHYNFSLKNNFSYKYDIKKEYKRQIYIRKKEIANTRRLSF